MEADDEWAVVEEPTEQEERERFAEVFGLACFLAERLVGGDVLLSALVGVEGDGTAVVEIVREPFDRRRQELLETAGLRTPEELNWLREHLRLCAAVAVAPWAPPVVV
jgi:hypothetical protein